jgi:Putative beta-barrel porin-2, OmpL-like. bbp2
MKFNKWTVGLAAAGIVTLPSLAQAAAPNMVQTMAENTTLSGYVDTSAQWNSGNGNANNAPIAYNGQGKADGFNLNVVDLTLDKPMDETPWAAGYHAEFWFGPDAGALGTTVEPVNGSDSGKTVNAQFAIKQAYVALRTPIGNGVDWKIGVFDTILGYESADSPNDPNFTRSYGNTIEPTENTGFLATYKFSDEVSASAGMANTISPQINQRNGFGTNEQTKAFMASVTVSAPQNWGWLAGSSMSVAFMHGWTPNTMPGEGGTSPGSISHAYAGVTLSTPVTGLKVGAAFDYRHVDDAKDINSEYQGDTYVYGLYASYQATEKLSLHVRGEFMNDKSALFQDTSDLSGSPGAYKAYELTLTAQYDLWKNVLSRVEARWDHADTSNYYGGSSAGNPVQRQAWMLAANVIYKF